MSAAREEVLQRVRLALTETRRGVDVPRHYREVTRDHELVERLTERLTDYKAHVVLCELQSVAAQISRRLREVGSTSLLLPEGLPAEWTAELGPACHLVADHDLAPSDLDRVHAVLTTCSLAIAETGTIVLDHGRGQGRRALSLVPDHHLVVVRAEQVVAGVVDAVAQLDPTRPMTWISGPSATSDIELKRVEGVHGPRRLDVLVVR